MSIPADIGILAAKICERFDEPKYIAVARAILAERERCAQIADGWAAEPDPEEVDPYEEYEMGGHSYSRSIAAAIRSPERAGE